MKKVICLLLLCSQLHSQCEECFIIRGDANCDGSVNIADVLAIAGGTWSNGDAADVNDDGAVNVTDSVYLSAFLFQGGPAPPCPGLEGGRDCTQDVLELCCSPPLNLSEWPLPNKAIGGVLFGTPVWGEQNTLTVIPYNNGDNQLFRVTVINPVSCDHHETWDIAYMPWSVTDAQGFTRKRLRTGVQKVKLLFRADPIFYRGAVCQVGQIYCDGRNFLLMQLNPLRLRITVSGGQSFEVTYYDQRTLTYVRYPSGGQCALSGPSVKSDPLSVDLDITEQLEGLGIDDCSVKYITKVEAFDVSFIFSRDGGDDIATFEAITADIKAEVRYDWCYCP